MLLVLLLLLNNSFASVGAKMNENFLGSGVQPTAAEQTTTTAATGTYILFSISPH